MRELWVTGSLSGVYHNDNGGCDCGVIMGVNGGVIVVMVGVIGGCGVNGGVMVGVMVGMV